MPKFILCQDDEQSKELISCGFELLQQSQGPQGTIYVFLNNKALFDQYTKTGKKLFTTNTLTF